MNYLEGLVEQLIEKFTDAGLHILYAALILIIGIKAAGFLTSLIRKSRAIARIDAAASSFLLSLLRIVLNALVIITAAVILGIPMTSFITVLASCGVAVGLALQGSLSNFAGGLMLLIFKPFKAGDYIKTGEYEGEVRSVSVFYTTLTTLDNKVVTLPNGSLTASAVVNYSANPTRRSDFHFEAAYGADPAKVRAVLLEVAFGNEYSIDQPAPVAFVCEHNASGVGYALQVWTKNEHYWDVRHSIPEQVERAFAENNIEIPFPQMDVHMR